MTRRTRIAGALLIAAARLRPAAAPAAYSPLPAPPTDPAPRLGDGIDTLGGDRPGGKLDEADRGGSATARVIEQTTRDCRPIADADKADAGSAIDPPDPPPPAAGVALAELAARLAGAGSPGPAADAGPAAVAAISLITGPTVFDGLDERLTGAHLAPPPAVAVDDGAPPTGGDAEVYAPDVLTGAVPPAAGPDDGDRTIDADTPFADARGNPGGMFSSYDVLLTAASGGQPDDDSRVDRPD